VGVGVISGTADISGVTEDSVVGERDSEGASDGVADVETAPSVGAADGEIDFSVGSEDCRPSNAGPDASDPLALLQCGWGWLVTETSRTMTD